MNRTLFTLIVAIAMISIFTALAQAQPVEHKQLRNPRLKAEGNIFDMLPNGSDPIYTTRPNYRSLERGSYRFSVKANVQNNEPSLVLLFTLTQELQVWVGDDHGYWTGIFQREVSMVLGPGQSAEMKLPVGIDPQMDDRMNDRPYYQSFLESHYLTRGMRYRYFTGLQVSVHVLPEGETWGNGLDDRQLLFEIR